MNFWKHKLFIISIVLSIKSVYNVHQATTSTTQKYNQEIPEMETDLLRFNAELPHHLHSSIAFNEEEHYYDKSEGDEGDEDSEYDDEEDLGETLDFGKKLGTEEDDNSLPIFLFEPQSTFVTKNRPATLNCKAAHALELTFKCSGSSHAPPLQQESHVDPHSGVTFLEVTSTVNRNLVDEYFGKDAFKCECIALSSRGSIKSQPAVIEVACKYFFIIYSFQILSPPLNSTINQLRKMAKDGATSQYAIIYAIEREWEITF